MGVVTHFTVATGACTSRVKSVFATPTAISIGRWRFEQSALTLSSEDCCCKVHRRRRQVRETPRHPHRKLPVRISSLSRKAPRKAIHGIKGAPSEFQVSGKKEGADGLFLFGTLAVTSDSLDLVDLEIDRPRSVDHDMELRDAIVQNDTVGTPGKEINNRRTGSLEIRSIHPVFQSHILFVENDNEVHIAAIESADCLVQAVDSKNKNRCGQAKYSCSKR